MDREKMIEEMKKSLREIAEFGWVKEEEALEKFIQIIPEGVVVLTKEEYKMLRESLSETTNRECELADTARKLLHENDELKAKNAKLLDGIENLTVGKCALYCPLVVKARKETAREIYDKLLMYFPIDKQFTILSRYTLDNVFKEVGVEVE